MNTNFIAPFYIFIKDHSSLSDEDLLKKFELTDYQLVEDNEEKAAHGSHPNKTYLFFSEDNHWKHLMDDWLFTLFNQKELPLKIEKLSKEFDIFCCSVDDPGESYRFVYFQNGIKKREYSVEDTLTNELKITKDFGEKLAAEKDTSLPKNQLDKVLFIAQSLGINTNHQLDQVRCYGKIDDYKFIFNEDEY